MEIDCHSLILIFLPIFESRQDQRIDLRGSIGTGPTGIYRCDIETEAVHDNGMRETVYVGLYTSDGGKITSQRIQSPSLLSIQTWFYSSPNMYVTHLGVLVYNKFKLTCDHYIITSACACTLLL